MILVIANYRTGSTTLVKQLAEHHGYSYSSHGGEYLINNYHQSFDEDSVIKVMPNQIHKNHWQHFCNTYCANAERIYYALRKDYDAQLRSWQVAHSTHQWHPEHIEPHSPIKNHKPKAADITLHNVPVLMNNLNRQAELYRKYGGKLVWLEDRVQQPYNRTNAPTIRNPEYSAGITPIDYFL